VPLTAAKAEVAGDEVREALRQVLASPGFRNSPQLSSFLSYVVDRTLAGRGSQLKAYSIATEALGRPTSFDPTTDATVRVLANRVRSALELFNLKNAREGVVIIDLLPGSYAPTFRRMPTTPAVLVPAARDLGDVVIRPLQFNNLRTGQVAEGREHARRLLILDDEKEIRSVLTQIGKHAGFQVVETSEANEFWVAYKALRPTHVILDLIMPGADGLEIMRELGRLSAKCRVSLVSGVDVRLLRTSERLGREFGLDIAATIQKPFRIADVEKALVTSDAESQSIGEAELCHAMMSSQLGLHYQPKMALGADGTSTIAGLEALVRWNHPTHGCLGPDLFIPLAEETGLIVQLTHQVLDMAIRQLVDLNGTFPGLTMAINISATLLDDPGFPDLIAAKCDAAGLEKTRIILEITETVAARESGVPIDCLTRLRLKGFVLSIDDFGTGYSSLLRLLQLPFNELKIDRSFVQECLESDDARLIIGTITKLAKSLGLRSCAEGVESVECLTLLRSLGCDLAQGFLFSKPVAADQLPALLNDLATRQV
jgi:EAL domain-containing protein (putative c-di-GMP-specific phosphodiesterase class I)